MIVPIVLLFIASLFGAKPLTGHNTTVYYWGQNSAGAAGVGSQTRLRNYCTADVDILVLSFLIEFGRGFPYVVNFANMGDLGELFPGTELLHLPQIGEDIKYCQGLGKQILLSLGGASGAYGFNDDADAQKVAAAIRDLFGSGSSTTRPFDDAVVDGYDLDIEGGGSTGYTAFVKEMRRIEPGVIFGAAPQCVYPDAYLQPVLDAADIDYAFVQFYNNYCSPDQQFNFDTWDNWASTKAVNKNVRVFLGTPASRSAANGGYLGPSLLPQVVDACKRYASFGGIMMWDASQAWANNNYQTVARNLLK